jgi:hypothetical protein
MSYGTRVRLNTNREPTFGHTATHELHSFQLPSCHSCPLYSLVMLHTYECDSNGLQSLLAWSRLVNSPSTGAPAPAPRRSRRRTPPPAPAVPAPVSPAERARRAVGRGIHRHHQPPPTRPLACWPRLLAQPSSLNPPRSPPPPQARRNHYRAVLRFDQSPCLLRSPCRWHLA